MGWLDFFSVVLTIVVAFSMPQLLVLIPNITNALKALGVDESEEPEVIGDKMLQAEEEGITPDSFDNYEEYSKAIENFELDPEKSTKYTEKEKLEKYAATHLTELQKVFGIGALTYLTEVAIKQSKSFNADGKVKSYLENFGSRIENVNSYFKGELSAKEMINTENRIVDLEKKLNPKKPELEILDELSKERSNVQEG